MTYTEPLLVVFLAAGFLGLWRAQRRKRVGVLAAAMVGLFAISWPPVNWLLSRPLEAGYPVRPYHPGPDVQAVVVLAAAFSPPHYERPFPLADPYTYERCEYAAWIYRSRPMPVLACEGRTRRGPVPAEHSKMRGLLERLGVPGDRIWIDGASGSTYENALYGARILRSHGVGKVALVVEADSMPRASACFRKQGIAVEPAPSDFRELGNWREELLPSWKAIRENEVLLHEVLGMAWYRVRGWI